MLCESALKVAEEGEWALPQQQLRSRSGYCSQSMRSQSPETGKTQRLNTFPG